MDSTRRTILAAGAAAAATAAVPRVFAQQAGKGGTGKFYEKGSVRIYYEEAGSGFPLLLLPGGGLNSTIAFFTGNSPFNAIEEFKGEYRCITADLRNAPSGQSTGPVEVDRPWESYADDRSTSTGPVDWPLGALRRSAVMHRYCPLNSSIALKGELPEKKEMVEFNPPPGSSNSGNPEPASS